MKKIAISIYAKQDFHLASLLFEENIDMIQYASHNTSSIGFYNPDSQFPHSYSESDTIVKPNNNKSNATKLVNYIKNIGDLDYSSKQELLKDYNFDTDQILEDYFLGYIHDNEELKNLYKKLSITFTDNFTKFTTRGYSQGDCATCYVDKKAYKALYGAELDKESMQKEIDHLYWDAPICGTFSLSYEYYKNCVTYNVDIEIENIDEVLRDRYELVIDIDIVMALVKEQHPTLSPFESTLLIKELKKIDYNDLSTCECICA